jgi:hypothetical protein
MNGKAGKPRLNSPNLISTTRILRREELSKMAKVPHRKIRIGKRKR